MELCSGYQKSADIYFQSFQLRQALVHHIVAYRQGFPIAESTFLGLEVYFSCNTYALLHVGMVAGIWTFQIRWQAAEARSHTHQAVARML